MTLFAAFFLALEWESRADRAGTTAAARHLLVSVGAVNTLVLLTSSLLVVLALRAHRAGLARPAGRAMLGAVACAVVFAVLKTGEYVHVVGGGTVPTSGTFFTFYFVLTGIHLLHVLIGVVLLLTWRARRGRPWVVAGRFAEGAAVYWHMVDLLWVVLFTVLYVGAAS